MIDFSKLSILQGGQVTTDPKEIFRSLPNSEYNYLRDVQGEVLTQWFKHKDKKNTVIKMNTGSGKTVIALLILKSCLNENKGPAVYVVPDNYLVEQVKEEARKLGIEVTLKHSDSSFMRGNSILIANISTLFNGKTVFGMRETDNIKIGSIIIDDVHTCLESMENSTTLEFKRGTKQYEAIKEMFREELCEQCEVKFTEIEDGKPSSMLVPYWAWIDKQREIIKVIN